MMNHIQVKAQPLVGPFTSRLALLLGIIAVLVAYQPLGLVVVELALIAGLFVLLWRPWLIWPVIGLALPFASAVSIGPATFTDVLIVGALGIWLIDGARRRELRVAFGLPALLFLLFVVYHICLLFIAVDLGEALPEVVKWVEILIVLAFLPPMVSTPNRQWVIAALLFAGSIQALLGIYQFVYQVGHPSFILMERFMRASGTFAQPNPFAGYLGTLLPIGVSLTLFALSRVAKLDGRFNEAGRELLVVGGMTALIGLGMVLSWSRGGWLGTLAAVGFVAAFRSRRALILSTAFALILLSVATLSSLDSSVLPASVQARVGNLLAYTGVNMDQVLRQDVDDDNFAIIERLAHWKAAILMWRGAILFGIGPGGYATAYPEVIQTDSYLLLWEDPLGHAHNIYLNFLAEIGVVGLLLYLGILIGLFGWVWRQIRRRSKYDGWSAALAVGVFGMLLYVSVHSLFDNLYVRGIYLHLGFVMALLHED